MKFSCIKGNHKKVITTSFIKFGSIATGIMYDIVLMIRQLVTYTLHGHVIYKYRYIYTYVIDHTWLYVL